METKFIFALLSSIALIILLITLFVKLLNKKEELKIIKKERDELNVRVSFLGGMIHPNLFGPDISTLEVINLDTLSYFNDKLATFYKYLYFENENTAQNLGKFLSNARYQIMDEKRMDMIENILEEAMFQASPQLLGTVVANVLSREQTEKGDTLEYLENTKNFILKNLSNERAIPFFEEFDVKISEIIKTFDKRTGETIAAHAVIIKNSY